MLGKVNAAGTALQTLAGPVNGVVDKVNYTLAGDYPLTMTQGGLGMGFVGYACDNPVYYNPFCCVGTDPDTGDDIIKGVLKVDCLCAQAVSGGDCAKYVEYNAATSNVSMSIPLWSNVSGAYRAMAVSNTCPLTFNPTTGWLCTSCIHAEYNTGDVISADCYFERGDTKYCDGCIDTVSPFSLTVQSFDAITIDCATTSSSDDVSIAHVCYLDPGYQSTCICPGYQIYFAGYDCEDVITAGGKQYARLRGLSTVYTTNTGTANDRLMVNIETWFCCHTVIHSAEFDSATKGGWASPTAFEDDDLLYNGGEIRNYLINQCGVRVCSCSGSLWINTNWA